MDLENDCGGRIGPIFDTIDEENIHSLVGFINEHDVPLTLFIAGRLFEEKKRELRIIQNELKNIEFALHSYSHPNCLDDYSEEIEKAVMAYTNFMGVRPLGYRAPQGKISEKDFKSLQRYSFRYDSSIIPTVRPGVFNNRTMPAGPFAMEKYDLLEIPCSVFPFIRIPIGLGFMRLLGQRLTRIIFKRLPLPSIIVLVFHLHDIVQTEHVEELKGFWKFFYQRKVDQGFKLLDWVIKDLKKKGYHFDLMKNVSPNAIQDFQP